MTRKREEPKRWDPDAEILEALSNAIMNAHVASGRRPERYEIYAGTAIRLRAVARLLKHGIPSRSTYHAAFDAAVHDLVAEERTLIADSKEQSRTKRTGDIRMLSKNELREHARRSVERALGGFVLEDGRRFPITLRQFANGVHRLLEPWIAEWAPARRAGQKGAPRGHKVEGDPDRFADEILQQPLQANPITDAIEDAIRPLVTFDGEMRVAGGDVDEIIRAALRAAKVSKRERDWWFDDQRKSKRRARRTSTSVRRVA